MDNTPSSEKESLFREKIDEMFKKDAFSQWLGIQILNISPGSCSLQMMVRPEMLNGFGIAHGGILFSLADSAFAFASNSHGKTAVSIETSISLLKMVNPGDQLLAKAEEVHLSRSLGRYSVAIFKDREKALVAQFHGTVFFLNENKA